MAHRYISGAEANLILTKVASYVAGYLKSEGYRYQPPTEDGYMHKLVGPNEATIYLNVSGHTSGDRINISGGFNIGSGRTGSGVLRTSQHGHQLRNFRELKPWGRDYRT